MATTATDRLEKLKVLFKIRECSVKLQKLSKEDIEKYCRKQGGGKSGSSAKKEKEISDKETYRSLSVVVQHSRQEYFFRNDILVLKAEDDELPFP